MDEVIVLVNFNKYLGGGETLMVRFCEYLRVNNQNFIVICSKESFIKSELISIEINPNFIREVSLDHNFFYLNQTNRREFVKDLKNKIGNHSKVRFVTFQMRDLYTVFNLSNEFKKCSITHLILHPQDNFYLGQTIINKIYYKIFNQRIFSNSKILKFNQKLLHNLNNKKSLISMSEIINLFWEKTFQIKIPKNRIVPLPSFKVINRDIEDKCIRNNKIIWIGRLVDFKIPSILAMINFISNQTNYEFSIVGDGDIKKIQDYIDRYKLDTKRIHFLGKVPYDKLGEVIKKHSIGYGMGTSLIELAKYKIPVIVALASLDHKLFKNQICGGLFFNKSKGYDGTDLILKSPESIGTFIGPTIKEIELDYDQISKRCWDFAKNEFSENENFSKYVEIIQNSSELNSLDKKTQIPSVGFLRSLLHKNFWNNEI